MPRNHVSNDGRIASCTPAQPHEHLIVRKGLDPKVDQTHDRGLRKNEEGYQDKNKKKKKKKKKEEHRSRDICRPYRLCSRILLYATVRLLAFDPTAVARSPPNIEHLYPLASFATTPSRSDCNCVIASHKSQ
ncbi:hypothetical protein B296_00002993 [Ensete ventricosum]|uniref:Uncharacterized protein n=1 Tax=Ensete ventricosum TaxID=4639 RepID=A0A426Z5M1_ENSVE|nr:hypothetical protein B296_00002993 [Ensete ventricosum]